MTDNPGLWEAEKRAGEWLSPFYDKKGTPCQDFNRKILSWLDCKSQVRGRRQPPAFNTLRNSYLEKLKALEKAQGLTKWDAHRKLLSNLTDLMLNVDLAGEISKRLTKEQINVGGFRSTLSQGVAKNTGENFTNIIVYALADALAYQDEILVDKNLPPEVRKLIELERTFTNAGGKERKIKIKIEGDFCIFSRKNPANVIIVSGKTRLKEVFHIAPMWKLLLDMVDDDYCRKKWRLTVGSSKLIDATKDILYVFVTADMVPSAGRKTQGGDVERDDVRNLIAMDASFLDYVFVSKEKEKAPHVSATLDLHAGREALFHEMGCLLDLIQQKFSLTLTAQPAGKA